MFWKKVLLLALLSVSFAKPTWANEFARFVICVTVQNYEKHCSHASYAAVSSAQCLSDYERECGVPPVSSETLQNTVTNYLDLCGETSTETCRESLSQIIDINYCPYPDPYETTVPCPEF